MVAIPGSIPSTRTVSVTSRRGEFLGCLVCDRHVGPDLVHVVELFERQRRRVHGRLEQFIQENRITVWYSAPTAIRSLMRDGTELVQKYDLSSLRHLCSVGEPLNAEAVVWSEEVYGLPFHDTFWQTETGSMMISNYPGMKVKPGSMGRPFPGITAAVLHLKTHEPLDEPGAVEALAIEVAMLEPRAVANLPGFSQTLCDPEYQ